MTRLEYLQQAFERAGVPTKFNAFNICSWTPCTDCPMKDLPGDECEDSLVAFLNQEMEDEEDE